MVTVYQYWHKNDYFTVTKGIPNFCFVYYWSFLSFSHSLCKSLVSTQVQQMFPLYFGDIAILSCLQVRSLKHCRELHRAQFCSWVFCCPHREADGWWFFLLSGFSLSWEVFWANSPEQQQSRDELLGISRLEKGRVASAPHGILKPDLSLLCAVTIWYQTWQVTCHGVGDAVLVQGRYFCTCAQSTTAQKGEMLLHLRSRRNFGGFISSAVV